jgi:hypothetical protein
MKVSKTHEAFSKRLRVLKVLTTPQDYLGPNWQDVINFWLYVDSLSAEEKNKIAWLYWNLDYKLKKSAEDIAYDISTEVVGDVISNVAWSSTMDVSNWSVFAFATLELIGSHKLLEQGKSPTFLPLCNKKKNRFRRLLSSIKQFLNL